jgi:hypothetical protein
MSISSVSHQSAAAQAQILQQASATLAASSDEFDVDGAGTSPAASVTGASAGNSLTGSTSGSLSSSTLGALLGLTQTDNADPFSTMAGSSGTGGSATSSLTAALML